MIVPDIITSESREHNEDCMSVITMNFREDSQTIATATPTLINPNKRRRIMRHEPPLTDEVSTSKVTKLRAAHGGWGSKVGIKQSPTSPANASVSASMTASFVVPVADFQDCQSPYNSRHSYEELSIDLCKIVATEHYSRAAAFNALKKFCNLASNDDAVFLENFLELGGIQRVLLYLQNNKGDPACVEMAAKVIMACTYRTTAHKSYDFANSIVKAFSKRDGVQSLLDASSEYEGENMPSQFKALQWIWSAIMTVTDKSAAYESSDPVELKDRLLSVFEAGLETTNKLGRNACRVTDEHGDSMKIKSEASIYQNNSLVPYNAVGGADHQLKAVQWIFSSLCGTGGSRKRAAMDMMTDHRQPVKRSRVARKPVTRKPRVNDNSEMATLIMGIIFSTWSNIVNNSNLVRDDFVGLNLLQKFIATLKSPHTGEWIQNKNLLIQASRFFVHCREKGILSTIEDFELVFPLVVECIGKYPESAFEGGLFKFVKDSYSDLDSSFVQSSGVVRAIASAWESDQVDQATKTASHKLLKELL